MSSLWRVLALAWLSAGAPSAPQESLLTDQVIAREAETGDEASLASFGSTGLGRPDARPSAPPRRR